ncbi:MAG: hypothetical protein R2932_46220 [Caldilineaceae bacterium]
MTTTTLTAALGLILIGLGLIGVIVPLLPGPAAALAWRLYLGLG